MQVIGKKESASHQPPRLCEVQCQTCSEKHLTPLAARCHVGKANDHCSLSKNTWDERLDTKDGKPEVWTPIWTPSLKESSSS